MADRMIVMNGGVAEQIGTPLDVYERPRTLFAAQFIGSPAMNVVDAEMRGGVVHLGEASLGETSAPDGPVKLGLRPEHLHRDENGPIALEVQLSEPLGANTLFHGRLQGTPHAFTASIPGVHRPEGGGQILRLSADASDLHLFDPATGQRL